MVTAAMGKPKSFARQIAELEGPIPKEFDPEEDQSIADSQASDSESSNDGLDGTEHYVEVGKSKLREPVEVLTGPAYKGSRISRKDLLVEDYENDVDEESNAENEDDVDIGNVVKLAPIDHIEGSDVEDEGWIEEEHTGGDFGERREQLKATNEGTLPAQGRRESRSSNLEDEGDAQYENGVMFEPPKDVDAEVDNEEKFPSQARLDKGVDKNSVDIKDQQHDGLEDGSNDSQEEVAESGFGDSEDQASDSDGDSQPSPSSASEADDDEKTRRDELRRIMSEEQKTVVATISQAAKADVDKGNAVKQQRMAFDSLLNVRMHLQKALIASNSMSAIDFGTRDDDLDEPYKAAEEAALKLWNTLAVLRQTLHEGTVKTGQKRKHVSISSSTPSESIWATMQSHEAHSLPHRHSILEKWSSKVKASKALPISRGLNPFKSQQQSLTTVLQDYLSDSAKLIGRTRIPRSCAPVQAKSKGKGSEGGLEGVYDDADWYQLLLQELVASKRSSTTLTTITNITQSPSSDPRNLTPGLGLGDQKPMYTLLREARTRKNVDTKASKGRKLRYGVHEKLVSFMAREDRRAWEEGAIERLFGGLLGRGEVLVEMGDGDGAEQGMEEEEEQGALRLFRSL